MRTYVLLLGLALAASACTSNTTTTNPNAGGDTTGAPADVAAPTVSTTLGRFEVIQGEHSLPVTASDDVAIARTELFVDGEKVAEATSAPFAIDWDSAAVEDGVRWLRVVAYDAAGNTAETADVPVLVVNAGKVPGYEETKSVVEDHIQGTFEVPADWDGNEETIDLKYHFTPPAGMKRAIAVLSWESQDDFDVAFSIGTGWCPDSGEMKKEIVKKGGEALLQYSSTTALDKTQWFIHLSAKNAAQMKGKSFPFKAHVAVMP